MWSRSRLPNVLPLGCPPCVSTGSAGDGREGGRSPEHQNRRIWRRWDRGGEGRCAACYPRVLLCRLQRPVRSVLRVLRVLRVLHVLPPACLWRTDVTSFAFCRSLPRRRKVRVPKKDPRSPQKALQKALPHVRRSQQGAMVVRKVSRCALRGDCCLPVMTYGSVLPLESALACVARSARVTRYTCLDFGLLWRTAPRFPRSAGACASEGGAPRLPGTPCRTGGGSRYENGSQGQDDGRRNPRSVEGWEGWEGEEEWEGEGSQGFFSPLGEPSPGWPDPDESRGGRVHSPLCGSPLGKFQRRQALFLNRRRIGGVVICASYTRFLGCTITEYYGDRTCSARRPEQAN